MTRPQADATGRVGFALPPGGVDAVIAALHEHDRDLPAFVYERIDPVTRRPLTTWIGLRTAQSPPQAGTEPFASLRSAVAACGGADSGAGVLAFVAYPAPEAAGTGTAGTRPAGTGWGDLDGGARDTPASVVLAFAEYLLIDHERGGGQVVTVAPEGAGEEVVALQRWARLCAEAGSATPPVDTASQEEAFGWEAATSPQAHARGVEGFRARRGASGVDGVVLSVQMASPVPSDPVASYRALRAANPSTCMFLLRTPGFALWGATSLALVQVHQGRLLAETDGATRAFPDVAPGRSPEWEPTAKEVEEYEVVARALAADLAPLAAAGTLRATREREQRVFSGLGHLFAEMQADVAEGLDAVDVVRALSPHGATLGHPRPEALRLVAELEEVARGPFAGAIGVLGADGSADVASVTRSMWTTAHGSFTAAGAKVVTGSVAAEEYRESVLKTAPLRATARRATTQPAATPRAGPAPSAP